MDAHAHLLSLGWAGPGHALDSKPYKQKGHRGLAYDPSKASNTGNGLVKPLLISQRQGRLGIGKKAHEPQAGNEWWLKGFESALGNIGKSESERSSGASTPVPNYTGRKHSGLYSFFVKGQEMAGTIDENGLIKPTKKRKTELLDGADDSNSENSTIQTSSRSKRLKSTPAAEFEQVSEYIALRDKGEKRRGRTERPSPVEEFRQVGEYIQARSEGESKKRKRRSDEESNEADTPSNDVKTPKAVETKEDRRERRRRRREEKERSRVEEDVAAQGVNGRAKRAEDEDEDLDAKAERKKRKAEKAAKLSD